MSSPRMSPPKKAKIIENEMTKIDPFIESKKLITIENDLCTKLGSLKFQSPVEYIYNPLKYAKNLHENFINKYFEKSTKTILFLGMNPGPWGMCQTGIVFGEKYFVKEWLKITGTVEKPEKEHSKRKITGLDCHRSEISGKKFWGFFKMLCKTPENFFKHSFVYNLCPLAFLDASGKNITPPEIKDKTTKKLLNEICDETLLSIINGFNFEIVICIGKFTEQRVRNVLKLNAKRNVEVCLIPHPSPRNTKNWANWEQTVFMILQDRDLLKFFNEHQSFDKSLFTVNKNECK